MELIVEQMKHMNDVLTVIAITLVLMLVFKQMH